MKEVVVQELSSPGCHNCAAFKAFWDVEQTNWPNVKFSELSIMEPEGQKLVQKYQIFASPGVVINDELFSTGGVDTDKFLSKLKELSE